MSNEWKEIIPEVNKVAEFIEISADFSDPLEIFREAISNSCDHGATEMYIDIEMEEINGKNTLVIHMDDNGDGMNKFMLTECFWALGNSSSKPDSDKIGEKGHGTKIYLKSDRVVVQTYHDEGSYESECSDPFRKLVSGEMHIPKFRDIDNSDNRRGTKIRVEGYNNNEFQHYTQLQVRDYLYWKTKLGSFEREFDAKAEGITVYLNALDQENPEKLAFGHIFAKETKNLDNLWDEYNVEAHDHYARKYIKTARLKNLPYVEYKAVIAVEGQKAKRAYNPNLRERKVQTPGCYRAMDRYGIYLAKDYIPVERKNEWLSGFGKGSNAFVLLHGFINCQHFKLTANRGSVSNTEGEILNELKKEIKEFIQKIDSKNYNEGLYTLSTWAVEEKTKKQEVDEYKRRKRAIDTKKRVEYNGHTLFEPSNESELFGLFTIVRSVNPEWFEFVPVDYNTFQGIDMLAYKREPGISIHESELHYLELKYFLDINFNHGFENIRWILAWDRNENIKNGTKIKSRVDGSFREFRITVDGEKKRYYLDSTRSEYRIQIFFLKQILENNGLTMSAPR